MVKLVLDRHSNIFPPKVHWRLVVGRKHLSGPRITGRWQFIAVESSFPNRANMGELKRKVLHRLWIWGSRVQFTSSTLAHSKTLSDRQFFRIISVRKLRRFAFQRWMPWRWG